MIPSWPRKTVIGTSPTYNVEFRSINVDDAGTWECKIEGTHDASGTVAESDTFTFTFDVCTNPAESCPFNMWQMPHETDTSWTAPLDISVWTDGTIGESVFDYSLWKDKITIACNSDVCGPRTYTMKLDDGSAAGGALPFPSDPVEDDGSELKLKVHTTDNT